MKKSNLDRRSSNGEKVNDKSEMKEEIWKSFIKPGLFRKYAGDLYSTRGNTTEGLVYRSRLENAKSSKFTQSIAENAKLTEARLKKKKATSVNVVPAAVSTLILQKRQCAVALERMIKVRLGDGAEENSALPILIQDGIIPSLMSLTSLADNVTTEHCTSGLALLASCRDARELMIQHGVVPALGGIASSTSLPVLKNVALSLCYLSNCTGMENKLVYDGLHKIVLRIFRSRHHEIHVLCGETLFNLTCNTAENVQGFDSIIQAVMASLKTTNSKLAVHALTKGIYNLTLSTLNHASIMAEGVFHIFTSYFQDCIAEKYENSAEFISTWLKLMVNLCTTRAIRKQVVSEKTLVNHVINCVSRKEEQVRQFSAILLMRLVVDKENRVEIVNRGAIKPLVSAIATANDDIKVAISWILRYLSMSAQVHADMFKHGVVTHVMQLCQSNYLEIKVNGLWTMSCLLDSRLADDICIADIVQKLVIFLKGDDDHLVAMCAAALYNISCKEDRRIDMIGADGICESLMHIVNLNYSASTRYAVMTIYNLTLDTHVRDQFIRHGALDGLQKRIEIPQVANYVLLTIQNLSMDAEFPSGEVLLPIFESIFAYATKAPSIDVQHCCIALLTKFCANSVNRKELIDMGIMKFVRWLYDSESDHIVKYCAYILYELAKEVECLETLFTEGIVALLINLSRSADEQVKELCILGISQLSSGNGTEYRLASEGAIGTVIIMALVTTNHEGIKIECTKTICNCLRDPNAVPIMVEDGSLWALASLYHLPNASIRLGCAVALCNLAFLPESKSKMLEAGIPGVLVKLSDTEDSAISMACLKTASNFLNDDEFSLRLISEGFISILRRHFSSTFKDVVELSSKVLLKISRTNTASCLTSINKGLIYWVASIVALKEPSLTMDCIVSLYEITLYNVTRSAVSALQIIKIIDSIDLSILDSTTSLLCCRILYNLTCSVEFIDELLESSIFESIHRFSNDAFDRKYRQQLVHCKVWIYHNLSCTQQHANKLCNEGIVPIILSIYQRYDKCKQVCASIISNIALGNVNSHKIIQERGGRLLTDFLVYHFTTVQPNDVSTDMCIFSAVLRKLSTPPGNQRLMMEDGVVPATLHILASRFTTDATILNCMELFAVLSKTVSNRGIMAQEGAIEPIIDIARNPTSTRSILAACFTAMSNLGNFDTIDYGVELGKHFLPTLMKLSENEITIDPPLHPFYKRGTLDLPHATVYLDHSIPMTQVQDITIILDTSAWKKLKAGTPHNIHLKTLELNDHIESLQSGNNHEHTTILGNFLLKYNPRSSSTNTIKASENIPKRRLHPLKLEPLDRI